MAATSDQSLRSLVFTVERTLERVVRAAERGEAVVAIDIPIGLPEREPRACDVAARVFLGWPRRCSVFPAPYRVVLGASDYSEACRLTVEARGYGKGVSHQLYKILAKIHEADEVISPALQAHVREAHPEVTFAALAKTCRGLAHRKDKPEGERERRELLSDFGLSFAPGQERARLGRTMVARDDIVDAAACLVTAYRIAAGKELALPSDRVLRDARGLRMEIVY